ncbi:MAG: cation:proton antiporter [bacterium]
MNTILGFGFILLAGLSAGRLINKIKFPSVTAYLLLGILIGPSLLGLVPLQIITISGVISNIVLGIIAFGIGQCFSKENFRKIGKSVLWISILEACGAWFFVTIAFLFILKQPFYIALIFGAVASATAPAVTIIVMKEYKAKGIFTDTLLGVVAIDDAWCLMIFAISLAISKAIYTHAAGNYMLLKVFFNSLLTIFGAFALGGVTAILLTYFSKFIRNQTELLIFTLGFVLFCVGIAQKLNLSVLLANMFLGAILVNLSPSPFKFFQSLETIDQPLFLLFFVLAGANLEIGILSTLGKVGLVYIIFRMLGKVLGANLGARISSAPEKIRKYLGWGLLPQGGVGLGCALVVKSEFPQVGGMIFTTIVATTVIFDLTGSVCSKFALKKAGEITLESADVKREASLNKNL